MRNLLTNAVFEKSFKANDKFKEPDLQSVPASYLYSDGDGWHFLDQGKLGDKLESQFFGSQSQIGERLVCPHISRSKS
jgi:translation elongation factor P/translation initiation factor 5A